MFCTGIENSAPTLDGGRIRVDEMESCGHYRYWREDFALVKEMGIQFLRYGPPLHTTFLGDGRYDWSFADETFAERFPWVQLYTPVNEMFICATFSARYGWWNEQMKSERGFVTAIKHLVRANVQAMRAILAVRPDALFIQSESSEYFHAENPAAIGPAEHMNNLRFLSLDLNYGLRVNSDTYEYLLDNGMTRDEYHFFLHNRLKRHCIMGNDYYATNEHRVSAEGRVRSAGEIFGYDEITRQYYNRYKLPVMHTETNFYQGPHGNEAVEWLWKQWANVLRVRNDGVPIVGFTWYSLTDQVDWDSSLRQRNGNVNPLGLYDLNRSIRPVGKAYRLLIDQWCNVLPTQSLCLVVPVVLPPEEAKPAPDVATGHETVALPVDPANPGSS